MHLTRITVEGKAGDATFAGTLELGSGVQIISGPNRFGKSLAFAAVAWCLGVEHIFGVQPGDNTIFPDAPRLDIDLGSEKRLRITESSATIELRDGARTLRLRRAIVGPMERIFFDDGNVKGDLMVGFGAMKDPTAGFQAAFRKWAGFPEVPLMTSRGSESQIYFENLAPLFLIEQLGGWADIQAEQVYRYGIQEVAEGAFEYLLGLDANLANRFRRQKSAASSAALKEEARSIAAEFSSVLRCEGWTGELTTTASVSELATRWHNLDLTAWLAQKFNFDAGQEQKQLADRVAALRTRLTKGKIDTDSTADTTEVSARVVTLKETRHEFQVVLGTLRSQLREQERLLRTVDERRKSARDLLRFKSSGIGILPKAECPTCHQTVDPAHLDLSEQSTDTLDIHVQQLDREYSLLAHNVDHLRADVADVSVKTSRLEREFAEAEHSLRMVNETVGPAREAIVKISGDLLAAERELDRIRNLQTNLDLIRSRIEDWVQRARDLSEAPDGASIDAGARNDFLMRLQEHVTSLGCAGVVETDQTHIDLDERYMPTLRGRLLRSYGSASDRARLILAYTIALAQTGKRHPGFLLLDEPLQQNPDEHHHKLLVEFLKSQSRSIDRQVVIFTALPTSDVEKLRASGVTVQVVEGKFLVPLSDKTPNARRSESSPA